MKGRPKQTKSKKELGRNRWIQEAEENLKKNNKAYNYLQR